MSLKQKLKALGVPKNLKSIFSGPKRIELFDNHYQLEQILVHQKSGNEYQIKEIQAKGFIVYLVKTLGNAVNSTQKIYISYEKLNEYK